MNDTSAAAASAEKFENRLEALIVMVELYKKNGQIIGDEVFTVLDLVGTRMLHTITKDMGWSPADAITALHKTRRELNEAMSEDPLEQIAQALGSAFGGVQVEDKRGPEVVVHELKGDDIAKFKELLKSGKTEDLDAFVRTLIDAGKKPAEPAGPQA